MWFVRAVSVGVASAGLLLWGMMGCSSSSGGSPAGVGGSTGGSGGNTGGSGGSPGGSGGSTGGSGGDFVEAPICTGTDPECECQVKLATVEMILESPECGSSPNAFCCAGATYPESGSCSCTQELEWLCTDEGDFCSCAWQLRDAAMYYGIGCNPTWVKNSYGVTEAGCCYNEDSNTCSCSEFDVDCFPSIHEFSVSNCKSVATLTAEVPAFHDENVGCTGGDVEVLHCHY